MVDGTGSALSQRLHNYMERKIPFMGAFILLKQCKDMDIDPDDIPEEKLEALAEHLGKASETFLGWEGSNKLRLDILYGNF